jgi:antitoxin FitA
MPSIQIKDVPPSVHATLRQRAALAGQSLQEYLLSLLTEEAETPTLDEVLDSAGSHSGGSITFEETVSLIREDRDSR